MSAKELAIKDSLQNELALQDTLRDVFRTIYKNTLFINISNKYDTAEIDTLRIELIGYYKSNDTSIYTFNGYYQNQKRYIPSDYCYWSCIGIGLIKGRISYLDCGNWVLSTFKNADTARAFFMERLKDRPDLQKLLR